MRGITLIEFAISLPVALGIAFSISDNLLPLMRKQHNIGIALELLLDQDVPPIIVRDDISVDPLAFSADPFLVIDQDATLLGEFFNEMQTAFNQRNGGEGSLFLSLALIDFNRTTGQPVSWRFIQNGSANVSAFLGRDCASSAAVTENKAALESYATNYLTSFVNFKPTVAKGIKLFDLVVNERECRDSGGQIQTSNLGSCASVDYLDKRVREYLPWIPVMFVRICEEPTQFIFSNKAIIDLGFPVRNMVGQWRP